MVLWDFQRFLICLLIPFARIWFFARSSAIYIFLKWGFAPNPTVTRRVAARYNAAPLLTAFHAVVTMTATKKLFLLMLRRS